MEPPYSTCRRRPRLSYRVVLSSLASCLLVLLVFSAQYNVQNPLRAIVPATRPLQDAATIPAAIPDASRPMIELHPEDHAYRSPKTQRLDWTVSAGELRPDGVLKRVYQINGLFPGPTVEARSGDTLLINVTNSLEDESFSIHWHGLHIDNSMDGVPGVTQHDIPPGSSFIYNITIPPHQSGTFWYHAHSGLARADGFYGGFIVHSPAEDTNVDIDAEPSAEKEILLLIGDWYHRPADQVMAWYMRAGSFGNEPVPDSLLINGVGHFNCANAVPARPVDCIDHPVDFSHWGLRSASGQDDQTTYKLRIVNTGSLAGFTLAFDNQPITLAAVDSVAVATQDTNSSFSTAGILYPGQRMDITISSPLKLSALTIALDNESFRFPNPALTPSQSFPIAAQNSHFRSSHIDLPIRRDNTIDIQSLPSLPHILSPLLHSQDESHQTAVLYTKVQKLSINHNIPYSFFNHTSWAPQSNPPIPLINLPREKWDRNQLVLSIQRDQKEDAVWVDMVVNNLDDSGHPFHLHGHHFYIIHTHSASIGWGSYNPFSSSSSSSSSSTDTDTDKNQDKDQGKSAYDLSRAMLRDTVYIPRRSFAVLRFRADNPGVWLFHCHILWHLASGMAMVVDVSQ